MPFAGTLDDAAMEFFSMAGAVEGTQGDRELTYWKVYAAAMELELPEYCSVSDILRVIAAAIDIPQTTVNEIEIAIGQFSAPPINSTVYDDVLKHAYISNI